MKEKVLITGVAGFIGAALAKKLLNKNYFVVGIDNLNEYYETKLKIDRLRKIEEISKSKEDQFLFKKLDLNDYENLIQIFKKYKPKVVINLAAQAGVRFSIEAPKKYLDSNISGFGNILEASRITEVRHLIFASSSSVYGGNTKLPYSESQNVDHPLSLYAATKKANELMAHSYSNIYNLSCTGLRFFTVYGPWGRPDMAPMIFAKSMIEDKPINVFNNGLMERDFTYIDDVINAIEKCCSKPAEINILFDKSKPDSDTSFLPYRIFNIGNNKPVKLLYFISLLEKELEKKAILNFLPMQKGDVESTWANIDSLNEWIGYKPKVSIEEGVSRFIAWYKEYFHQ